MVAGTAIDAEFRLRVRDFINRNAPAGAWYDGRRVPPDSATETALRNWYAALFDAGLMGGSWPAQYGGRDDHSPEGNDVYARWQQAFLWSRALTISGGSSEIVRNVLATQLLGLPRSW